MPCLHGSPCWGYMEEVSALRGAWGREGGPGMLRTISEDKDPQRAGTRHWVTVAARRQSAAFLVASY